ncbi:hypothetical protein ARSEF1564_005222 [Beauveria bassiana]
MRSSLYKAMRHWPVGSGLANKFRIIYWDDHWYERIDGPAQHNFAMAVERLKLPLFTNVLQGCYEIEAAKCTLMDTSDRKQIFRNEADLYSSSHPYGRVVARQMSKRQQFGTCKLHIASLHCEPGAGSDRRIGPPVLAQKTPINLTGSFRTLGDDIQRMIFSHLDYQSLIFLSQTSHHFHQMARPELADQQDQFQFVMRAEKEFKQHFPNEKSPGNFACYFCYRVLQADSFSEDQAHEAFVDFDGNFVLDVKPENAAKYLKVQLRRYCKSCGCKNGFDSFRDIQHPWSQNHAISRWVSNGRNGDHSEVWRDESELSSEKPIPAATLSNGPTDDRRHQTRLRSKGRKSDTVKKTPSPCSRSILEKWDATYLILHPDGTTYWAHRRTLGNRQMARSFDSKYRGFGLDVDVYDLRQDQTKEYLLHFRGRPAEECYWAKEDMLSPELRAAITY